MTSPTPDIDGGGNGAGKERLAQWMIAHSFATGHGDTFEDLLLELGSGVAALRAELAEAKQEIDRLRERLGPMGLVVVEINGSGHYVSEIVADHIALLKAERDEARDYGAQARIRENETEDRRIHDTDKLRAELAEERKHT